MGDERHFDQDGRNKGRLQYTERGLFRLPGVQGVDRGDVVNQLPPQCQTFPDGFRLFGIEDYLLQISEEANT